MANKIQIITIASLFVGGILVFLVAWNAPKSFPTGERFEVNEGETLYSVSSRLEEEHIVNSALLFRGWISLLGRDEHIDLGVYEFKSKLPLGLVVAKFVNGPDEPLLSVTIPEGFTTHEIGTAFKKALPLFSVETFESSVNKQNLNGYLFPSTYYPLPSFTEEEVIMRMKATFDREYEKNFKDRGFPKQVPSKQAVVSLAAILEGEAKTPKDMRIVSGILQKRLQNGMRLQVDAASSTYEKSGIPEVPISNPGVVAIEAVFNPEPSVYLYYLTGKDGKMYYAKTFEEHKKNITRYLR